MNICIIGTGYVGLVTAACLAESGNNVVCVDLNQAIIDNLNEGRVPIYEPGLEELVRRNRAESRLHFTTSLVDGLGQALFVFICVGTPAREDGSADLSAIYQVAREIGQMLTEYKIVVNKSTVPVGTADEVREIIAQELDRRKTHVEFDVVSNPEFLKEGDAINDFMKPDRIVIGTDNVRTAELFKLLYGPYALNREKLMFMGIKSAEMTKYAANGLLAAKISYINEIANICELVGADVREVRQALGADQRIGYHFIYPGVGYGGSCFPKDVKALIQTAQESGYQPDLLVAVDRVNVRQRLTLPRKIEAYFTSHGGIAGRTLALWGLSFKPNTDDTREAPATILIDYLTNMGMRLQVYDPAAGPRARMEFAANPLVEIFDRQYDPLKGAEALAIVTEWHQFRTPDFNRIKNTLHMPIIFDGRNLYSPERLTELGFIYFSIGRRPLP